MAIITCPECGQNPVSDRAPTCPKCGCPIAAAEAPVAPANPSTEPTGHVRTIQEKRSDQVRAFGAQLIDHDTEFRDTSVAVVNESTNPKELVNHIKGWCEEISLHFPVGESHVDAISRLSNLKSLDVFAETVLDDRALLQISKMQTLRKLELHRTNKGWTTEAGWLQLARLSGLEYLELPLYPGPVRDESEYDKMREIKRELRKRMPHTLIE